MGSTPRNIEAMSSSESLVVNHGNRLTWGLKFWPVADGNPQNRIYCVVSGTVPTSVITSVDLKTDYSDQGRAILSSGDDQVTFGDVVHDVGSGPVTMIVRYRSDDGRDDSGVISLPNNSKLTIQASGATPGTLTLSSQSRPSHYLNTPVVTGEWATWGFAHKAALGGHLPNGYKNGILQTPTTTQDKNYSGVAGVKLFSASTPTSFNSDGAILWAAVFNRQLTGPEMWQMHINPYQMFQRVRRVMVFQAPVAGSAYQYGAYWA